jgi:hypothetical protein
LRRIAALTAVLIGLGLASPGGAGAQERTEGRPVSGAVQDVNPAARTFMLGGETYHVPADVFDVSRLQPGESIIVHWTMRGNRMVVTRIEDRVSDG